MISGRLDSEWLIREVFTNEAFVFQFVEESAGNKFIRGKNLVWEMLGQLVDLNRANPLLEIGFQRQGLGFVNSYLFETFVKVHLYKVGVIRFLIWIFFGIC